MKRVTFILTLILAVSLTSFANKKVATGKTYSPLGNYKVERIDFSTDLLGEESATYLITYENSPLEVTVVVDKEKNCKTYLVISEDLTVQYVCNENYFGVEKVSKKYAKEGLLTNDLNLDRKEYFGQKVLSRGTMSEVESASMIACFFPKLLKAELTASK